MAHRVYLYNLDYIGDGDEHVLFLMEWSDELPLLLQPLFGQQGFIDRPMLNGDAGGLYAPAAEGLQLLRDLYALLERHAAVLGIDMPLFQACRERLFRFLEARAVYQFFHLEAWDVFNMSDQPHEEQAAVLLAEITANNQVIAAAIAADDPGLLDQLPLLKPGYHFSTFRELLNAEVYAYGWAPLRAAAEEQAAVVLPFEEGGLFGLKDGAGAVLLAPTYLQLFGFGDYDDWSVAEDVAHRFGYIDKTGREVIAFQYEDAYDFEGAHAAVKLHGKWGLIDKATATPTGWVYDDILSLSTGGSYWQVVLDGKQGVINVSGEVVLPVIYKDIILHAEHGGRFYQVVLPDAPGARYLTSSWQEVQLPDIQEVTAVVLSLADGGRRYAYIVRSGKEIIGRYGIVDGEGKVLVPAVYDYISYKERLGAYVVELDSQQGLYDIDGHVILEIIYDDISVLAMGWYEAGDTFCRVQRAGVTGLFHNGEDARWVLPLAYEEVEWLQGRYFGFRQAGLWGVVDRYGAVITAPQFAQLNSKVGELEIGVAIGFNASGVWVIEADGGVRMITPAEIREELGYGADMFYSEEELRLLEVAGGRDISRM